MKTCSKCKIEKSLDCFSKDNTTKDGLRYYCQLCRSKTDKKYKQSDKSKEVQKKASRKYRNSLCGYLHQRWQAMNRRCNDPKHEGYVRYGAKGIKCLFTFVAFYTHVVYYLGYVTVDMLKGLQIHRIDPDGDYVEDNIEFLTQKEHGLKHRELNRKLVVC